MKKQIIIPLLAIMVLFFGYGYAQKTSNQNAPGFDRDMTLKQQLAILKAGENNPVQAAPAEMDPRMDHVISEEASGPANDKLQPLEEDDREPVDPPETVIVQGTTSDSQTNSGTNSQPEGITPENVINYRNMNGDNSQPQPEKSGTVINYREMKGSNEQPKGDKPE